MATENVVRTSSVCHLPPARLIVAVLLALLVAACGSNGDADVEQPGPDIVRPEPEGEPRAVALGFGSLPAEQTAESYIQAVATAAQYGDAVMIQRTPPWREFMPGRELSEATIETTRLETGLLEQYEHLELVFVVDPTDAAVQRSRIADLPADISPSEGFRNEDVRRAFIAYVRYIVRNYEPEYLVIGAEINMLKDRSPEQFEAFVSLYDEAYANAKDANPDTKVFPSFQLEDLEGNLDEVHPPDWSAVEVFAERMDVLAVTTYPYLTDIRGTADIREDYYTQLNEHFEGEVMVVDAAYPSASVEGYRLLASEQDQQAFLTRLLSDAEAMGASMVIWRAALDPSYARDGALAVFGSIGLRAGDGSNKLAWETWEDWARRPLAPAEIEAPEDQ